MTIYSPHLCVGFLFLVVHSRLPTGSPARQRRPFVTHNFVTHSFVTHNFVTHNSFNLSSWHPRLGGIDMAFGLLCGRHAAYCTTNLAHILSPATFSHATPSRTRLSHTHTTLSHTVFHTHTQPFHTQHCHTPPTHTQLFTNTHTHTTLSRARNSFTHTHTSRSHEQLCHTQLLHTQHGHNIVTQHSFTHTHTTTTVRTQLFHAKLFYPHLCHTQPFTHTHNFFTYKS